MNLDQVIVELLKTNKNVIVPGLGSFIKSEGKASHTVLFNQFLKFNDKVLQKGVEQHVNCSSEEALKKIETYASEVMSGLETDGNYLIPGLGVLVSKAGKLSFEYTDEGTPQAKTTEATVAEPEVKNVTQSSEAEEETTSDVVEAQEDYGTSDVEEVEPEVAEVEETEAAEEEEEEEEVEPTILDDIDEAQNEGIEPIVTEKDVKTSGLAVESDAETDDEEEEPVEDADVAAMAAIIEEPKPADSPVKKETTKKQSSGAKESSVSKPVPEEPLVEMADTEDVVQSEPRKKKGLLWIGSIILLSGLALLLWLKWPAVSSMFGLGKEVVAEVNPKQSDDETQEAASTSADGEVDTDEPDPAVASPDSTLNSEVTSDTSTSNSESTIESVVEDPEPVVEKPEPVVQPPSTGKLYHIIGGAFSNKDNAETFVKQLKDKGYAGATIVAKRNGLHTVSFGGHADKQSAKDKLSEITSSGDSDGAWILYY